MTHRTQAIVLDLDGTFLTSSKQVSPRNLQAVMDCHRAGLHIIIATARPPRAVQKFLPESLLQIGYVICYNGAYIAHQGNGYRESLPIDLELAKQIHDFIIETDPNAFISFEGADGLPYSNKPMPQEHYAIFGATKDDVPTPYEGESLYTRPALKILLPHAHLHEPLQKEFGERISIIATDAGHLVQLASRTVAKQHAVQKVLAALNVTPADTMVFGGDLNDLGLFEFCGHAVAMGNAVSGLKPHASEITASNDEDGVALVLERVLSNMIRQK